MRCCPRSPPAGQSHRKGPRQEELVALAWHRLGAWSPLVSYVGTAKAGLVSYNSRIACHRTWSQIPHCTFRWYGWEVAASASTSVCLALAMMLFPTVVSLAGG